MATTTATSNSKNAVESYIGSFITLISKYEIRYEGLLYHLSVHDSTIGLKNVRSFGTEGRKKDGQQVPPSEKVYEYILFRGSDIKDLEVKSSPPSKKLEHFFEDPAIIQSQYAGVPMNSPPSTSVGDKTLKESIQWQDTPALISRANPGALPPYQPVTQVASVNQSQAIQGADAPSSFSAQMYWQVYGGISANTSYSPQHPITFESPSTASSPMMMQNGVQTSELEASPISGLVTASRCGTNMTPSISSTCLRPNFSPTSTLEKCCTTPDMPLFSSFKASLPSSPAYMTDPNLTFSSLTSTFQGTKAIEAQTAAKAVSDPLVVRPAQPLPNPTAPFIGSDSGHLLTPPPSLLTPDQLVPSGPPVLSSTQKICFDKKGMGTIPPTTSNPPLVASAHVNQAPLLPLPTPSLKSHYSTLQFTEEFDFEGMNEKFKKNEVWGYLGKAKQQDTEDIEDKGTDQGSGYKVAHGPINNFDSKPAYKKDDFFDTISCNSLNSGTRDGKNRFSERMKLDTETSGKFQSPYLDYGGYGGGRGESHRTAYTGGRVSGYGQRGCGGKTHL